MFQYATLRMGVGVFIKMLRLIYYKYQILQRQKNIQDVSQM